VECTHSKRKKNNSLETEAIRKYQNLTPKPKQCPNAKNVTNRKNNPIHRMDTIGGLWWAMNGIATRECREIRIIANATIEKAIGISKFCRVYRRRRFLWGDR
jgi:hypothetical protein